ncbi:KIN14B-interacting protein At4g14310-like [Olea europaea var. sylvestris]|uniref:KIN14B-interacting protein At4g14310-like n=1 Tax=Olea europaea var. sylvestris TaxID=158386 RepID=UPI000C1D31BD|nr:KIN14B-interacting protein At4g14310-like [Olea europaea var. sylvestris]
MSTSSVRRAKESSGKIAATTTTASKPFKSLTPVSAKSISTGKENSRPTSQLRAATQKPEIRPMVRIDKSSAAVAVEESRARRSTSSVPKGRSSSPSDITRGLGDLKKNYRVSLGPPQKKVNKTTDLNEILVERLNPERRFPKDVEKNGRSYDKLEEHYQLNGKIETRDMDRNNLKKEGYLSSIPIKRSDLENFDVKPNIALGEKVKALEEIKLKSCMSGVELGSNSREFGRVNKVDNVSGDLRENAMNKYPSKLHEKLAFLEGKVKRIASDINKTKDMLDKNNPDATKMILSDIQEKISGIEKAMGRVVGNDGDTTMVLIKNGENEQERKCAVDVKSSVKGLNGEELEARLFPHHKLIRERILSKTTSEGSGSHEVNAGESSSEQNLEAVNENLIALEFLASLSKEERKVRNEISQVQEMDDAAASGAQTSSLNLLKGKDIIDDMLMADEDLNELDDEEKVPTVITEEEVDDSCMYQLNDIGHKTSTGGWFVSEGESVLLTHDDGSCSFYDIANCEEKAQYTPPAGISPSMWRDCWLIRAPGADGCSGKYVVAASAGNSVGSGFCSWDFYTKDVRAFHIENDATRVRTTLAPLSSNIYRRNASSTVMTTENRQWWYNPCGPLIISAVSCQRMVQIYDIRDGDQVMKWELQKPVMSMDYASPLHWRNRGKVVIAEAESLSLWDVSSLSSQGLLSVSSSGRKISALHINNSDAEFGGGVRQRVSSSEVEGNDGVFCTPDSINVLDFRHPSGIGLKIPKVGVNVESVFSRGDSIYIGCTNLRSTGNNQSCSQIQQFSLRKQRLFSTYVIPESDAHYNFKALTQVWGNSSHVMGVCGLGLFVFDSLKDDGMPCFAMDYGNTQNVKEIIGPDDMYSPSFDCSASRILLISRDRRALWRYLL